MFSIWNKDLALLHIFFFKYLLKNRRRRNKHLLYNVCTVFTVTMSEGDPQVEDPSDQGGAGLLPAQPRGRGGGFIRCHCTVLQCYSDGYQT